MVSDMLGQLRAPKCASKSSTSPVRIGAPSTVPSLLWLPQQLFEAPGHRHAHGKVVRDGDLASCGHGQLWGKQNSKKVGLGNPQIERKYRKVIYHFNRIFLVYLFGGYYMLLKHCIPSWSLFFGSPADLSWMMDTLWQFDIAMKNGPFIWFITYQEYPKIVVFHGKR